MSWTILEDVVAFGAVAETEDEAGGEVAKWGDGKEGDQEVDIEVGTEADPEA